tara:strand:+ start:393 stop:575 length:183 start_codon:yes stop_codon:yes gene_type:complete
MKYIELTEENKEKALKNYALTMDIELNDFNIKKIKHWYIKTEYNNLDKNGKLIYSSKNIA